MRTPLLVLLLLINIFAVKAQTVSMSDIKPSKEAQKTAKRMQKEGWMDCNGQDMAKLLELGYRLAVIPLEGQVSSASGRYVIATSIETGSTENIARQKAEASCQAQIAQSINAEVTALVSREMTNQQLNPLEAETMEKVRNSVESISRAHLKKCFQVWEFLRKEDYGSFSVQKMMAFDKSVLYSK